jgi:hypothetical protein
MERTKSKLIVLKNDSLNPLSEREIVDATIAYANGANIVVNSSFGSPESYELSAEQCDMDLQGWFSAQVGLREQAIELGIKAGAFDIDPSVMNGDIEGFKTLLRTRLREVISLSLHDVVAAAETVRRGPLVKVATNLHSFGVRGSIGDSPKGGLRFNTEFTFENFVDLVELGLVLLLDDRRGFREKLCQCMWGPCGFLFFKIQRATGAPQRKYCCSEHMLKAHDLNAAERMKKRRRAAARKK